MLCDVMLSIQAEGKAVWGLIHPLGTDQASVSGEQLHGTALVLYIIISTIITVFLLSGLLNSL